MKSRAPLTLMEQLVMVLVFALSAAVCLQVFVLADRISQSCEARDRAVLTAQNAAETLKDCRGDFDLAVKKLGGDWDGRLWTLDYDESWRQADNGDAAYRVEVAPADSGQALLGVAEVTVCDADGEVLFAVSVAWQEVSGDA